jgi:hypothetical protein
MRFLLDSTYGMSTTTFPTLLLDRVVRVGDAVEGVS